MTTETIRRLSCCAPLRFRSAVCGLAALALTACGVTYNSPSVRTDDEDAPVTVVDMTSSTVAGANATPYTPRSLPKSFGAFAGSGSQQGIGAIPPTPDFPDLRQEANLLNPPPQIEPTPYVIGISDVVLIATRASATTVEQLSGLLAAQNSRQGYTVRDDGTIAIPEVGSLSLAGLTITEAEDVIFRELVESQLEPSFSLEVAEFNSQRVVVGGSVRTGATIPITLVPLTLGEAIAGAGGVQLSNPEFASIRIYRDGKLYQIPFEAFRSSDQWQKLILQNGDAIYVDTTYDLDRVLEFFEQEIDVIALRNTARTTALAALTSEINLQRQALAERREVFLARQDLDAIKRDYVYLTGEVVTQSRVPLPFERQASLADVLFDGGGFDTTTGDPKEIYVLRAPKNYEDGMPITAYHLNATNVTNLVLATKFEMRPDDIVFIEEQLITKWGRSLQQAFGLILDTADENI